MMLDFFVGDFYTSNDLQNTSLQELEYSIIDFETTGLYPYNGDRIIEAGICRVNSKVILNEYESLINPDMVIPEAVSAINHINQEMVETSPKIEEKIDEIMETLKNSVIVAHNLSFDMSFLNYQLQKMQRPKVDAWMVDTIKVAKSVLPEMQRYRLGDLTEALNIDNKESHRALSDAKATAMVLHALIQKMPLDATLKDLQAFKIH